jgi:hypothetical protein
LLFLFVKKHLQEEVAKDRKTKNTK